MSIACLALWSSLVGTGKHYGVEYLLLVWHYGAHWLVQESTMGLNIYYLGTVLHCRVKLKSEINISNMASNRHPTFLI